jgi:hypothetical protein
MSPVQILDVAIPSGGALLRGETLHLRHQPKPVLRI